MWIQQTLKTYRKQLLWIALGLLALMLKLIGSQQPELVERIYSRGLFIGVRWIIDHVFAWFPIPLIYLFVSWMVYLLIKNTRRFINDKSVWRGKLLRLVFNLLAFLGGALFFFLFLWGFNYDRVSLEKQIDIKPVPLNIEALKSELDIETKALIQLRSNIEGITDSAIDDSFLPENLEVVLREGLENWLFKNNYPTIGRVRGRIVYPKGIFLRFSSSGLYFPFTGEGHVDAGLNALQKVFVMAHELGHGYGFGDEGTCNFLAYINCTNSDDPLIAYLGHLAYWRTVAVNYLRYEREAYQEFRANLPKGIIADLNAINENLQKYPDILPELRYYAYDSYLKAQGIQEGMANYNRVIMLVNACRKEGKL